MLLGTGAALALPLSPALGANPTPPKRLVFLNFGFGPSNEFYPDQNDTGAGFKLSAAMQPLERHRDSFSFISNLSNLRSSRYGAHWGATTFLTGADVGRTPGRAFHNDISCDQVAASHIGNHVRYRSLELTDGHEALGMGPGMSMAWNDRGDPVYGEADPVAVFHKLFGGGGSTVEESRRLLERKRSVLDLVRGDARSVSKQLGAEDNQKLEQYFTLVRDIEKRLVREDEWLDRPKPEATIETPIESLTGSARVLAMFDLITAALQTDSTRVITYRMATRTLLSDFANESGSRVGAHGMTHFGTKDSEAYRALIWRDRKLCELFAALLDRLKETPDVDGNPLLDNTLLVFGSGIRTGHGRRNVPILLAGCHRNGVRQGQHVVYKQSEGRLANLWLSMLHHAGCRIESFADSTGLLTEIFS